MALLWLEGFETKEVESLYDLAYLGSTLTDAGFVTGRKGGRAAAVASSHKWTTPVLSSSEQNTIVVGFAFRRDTITNPTSGEMIHLQQADGDSQCALFLEPSGRKGEFTFTMKRDTTTIATATRAFAPNVWHYFVLKVVVRQTTNGSVTLDHYDLENTGTEVMSATGVNLAHQAADGASRVAITLAAGSLDDVFILDGSGSVNNDAPSVPWVIVGSMPDGDGNQSDWLPSTGSVHFSLVDDIKTSALGSDYIASATASDVDLFTYQDVSGTIEDGAATCHGVHVITTAVMGASGSQTLQVRVRSGSNEAAGATFDVDTPTTASFSTLLEINPTGTPAAWTRTTLDAAEFGIEVA